MQLLMASGGCPAYRKNLGEQSGGEEGGMLDNDVVALVLVRHIQLIQQVVCGLAHLQQVPI